MSSFFSLDCDLPEEKRFSGILEFRVSVSTVLMRVRLAIFLPPFGQTVKPNSYSPKSVPPALKIFVSLRIWLTYCSLQIGSDRIPQSFRAGQEKTREPLRRAVKSRNLYRMASPRHFLALR